MASNGVATVAEIKPGALALQATFCDFVPKIFTRADFRRWMQWGAWRDDARAFAVVEDGRVLANASARGARRASPPGMR